MNKYLYFIILFIFTMGLGYVYKFTPITNVFIIVLYVILFVDAYSKNENYKTETKHSIDNLRTNLRKTADREKLEQEKFYNLTKNIEVGIIYINDDGIIEYTNRNFKNTINSKKLIGKDFNNTINQKELKRIIYDSFLLEKKVRKQFKSYDKYYDVIVTPLFSDEIFQGCIVLLHDITVLKKAEELEKAFLVDASHELKTPVSAIKMASEILLRELDLNEKMNNFLYIIYKENERMHNIVKDLMTLSKLGRTDFKLTYNETNLKSLVSESIAPLLGFAENKNIELINDVSDDVIKVDIDKMKQALINLIKNAINYTNEGYVKVYSEINDKKLSIFVKDTGVGIEEQHLSKIFDRFYRIDQARSRDTGGTGLGLAIVKNIIRSHKGKINVTSKYGEGTEFEIIIPI